MRSPGCQRYRPGHETAGDEDYVRPELGQQAAGLTHATAGLEQVAGGNPRRHPAHLAALNGPKRHADPRSQLLFDRAGHADVEQAQPIWLSGGEGCVDRTGC